MDVMQCNLWWHTSMMRVHFSVQTTFFLKPSPCYLKKKKKNPCNWNPSPRITPLSGPLSLDFEGGHNPYSPTVAIEWCLGSAPIQPNHGLWATSWLGPSAAQLSPLSDMVWPQYSPTIAVERHLGLAPMQTNHHHWATSWLGPNTAQLSPLSDIMVWPQYSPTIAIERHLGSALMLFLSEEQCRGGN